MKFIFLLLLSLKVLKLWAFSNYPHNGVEHDASNDVEVVDYNKMGQGSCPNVKQPLCATNGEEVLYFDNKCLLEVRNFEQLMQGLKEYFECPLSYCSPQCAPCGPVIEPVCAVDVSTGAMENFPNPCEVERKICFTQREHRIISSGQCPSNPSPISRCPQVCTLEYNPVCAQFQTELRQFPNQCQLDKVKCETNKDWQIVDSSYCVPITDNTVASPFKSIKPDAECPEFCTLEYQPICARFMTLEKEFSNECELKTTICQTKQKWDIVRQGPCQETKANMALDLLKPKNKCPEFCTLEYDPICAKFNNELREFANRCELDTTICRNREDWQIIHQGSCPSVSNNKAFELAQKPKCPQFCTLEYRPICAQFEQELREFGNKCSMETIKCETGQDWQIINNGPCSSSLTELNNKAVKLSPKPDCPQFCTLEYRPICAQFNNELREFSNKCDLESTICQTNENWKVVHQGTCNLEQLSIKPKCPEVCTLEYRPICAQFEHELREFSNNCDLQRTICETNQKWQIVKQGTCFTDSSAVISECPQFCTKEYRPVCAEFKGKEREFANKCLLLQAICESNKKWELVKLGPCSKTQPSLFKISAPKCPKFCTREFNPICAKRNNKFREFSNKCVLETWNCESEEKWELVKFGPCPSIKPASTQPTLLSAANECPKFCTREYAPVCANRNNELREFSNKCVLDTWNCESEEKWELVNLGPCVEPALLTLPNECPKFCTREYKPICAKFDQELREFPNKCELLRTNCETDKVWEIVNFGTCPSKPPSSPTALISSANFAKKLSPTPLVSCPKFCSREYDPVCAKSDQELREFPNRCELQRENCESNKPWVFVNSGPCSSNSPKELRPTPLVSCPKFCTKEHNPVCAKSDEELREFANRCELLRENCESNKPWVFVNAGPCSSNSVKKLNVAPLKLKLKLDPLTPPCPQFCTDDLRPVCAEFNSELREFGNRCELQVTICQTKNKWKIVNEGPCPTKSKLKPECPKFCTKDFRPVCARYKGELREFPNKCEFQRSVCETNIAWELINNGPCLIKNFETDNIELQPICATDGKVKQMFSDPSELQEEIRKTGIAWSLLHNDECLTPSPVAKVANKAFASARESTTKKSTTLTTTTSTTPRSTSSNTSRTTAKPKTTTTPKTSTTQKTTTTLKTSTASAKTTAATKSSTTPKPKATTAAKFLKSAMTSTTIKPQHTTTTKTITATTTTPKTTTATNNKYSSTPRTSTTTDAHHQCSYEYSTENDSDEIDDGSKGYHEDHNNCFGCNSHEDYEAYSEENDNEEYVSWEDEEEDLEEDDDDVSEHYEDGTSYTIDDNKYTYKHNESNSTYTFIYGKEGSPQENDASERISEEIGEKKGIKANVEYIRKDNAEKKYLANTNEKEKTERKNPKHFRIAIENSKKESYSGNTKGKQGISSNNNSKSGLQTPDSIPPRTVLNNSKLVNVKTPGDNRGKHVGANQEDFKLFGDNEGENLIKMIHGRLLEEFGSQEPDDLSKEMISNTKTKQRDQIKPNQEDLKLFGDNEGKNLIKMIQERLLEEFGSQEPNDVSKERIPNTKTKQREQIKSNQEDLKLFGDNEGENLIKMIQNRLLEEFGSLESDDLSKERSPNAKTKQREQIKPKSGKANANTKKQQHIKTISGQSNFNLNTANQRQPKPNSNAALHIPGTTEGTAGIDQEVYGYQGLSNINMNTEQQVQTKANPVQTNLNSNAALYNPEHNKDVARNVEEIYGNLGNTNREQINIDSQSALYSPEYYEGPKDINKDNYENLLRNFHNNDESLEANMSNEEDIPQANAQGISHGYGPPSLNEKRPKFGVYSDEAYGLMDSAEVRKDDKWSSHKQAKESQYNNKNIENIYQNNENTEQNEQLPEYSSQSPMNGTHNTENILEVFEALLSESDAEEEDDETLVKQVLTTLGSETTTAYPSHEFVENQSNYTKREEYPSKYNHTKKGEIYNGAVYKAPVYDAPTYNFIYTAPNHPVMPLMPGNHHPFLQYPGFMPQNTDPAANPYYPFVPLGNQSNLGNPMETGPVTNSAFNPMQFLTSLAAMSSPFGSAMPNLMPLPQAVEYNGNREPETLNNPLDLQENPSQPSLNPSRPAVFNQILPQTHPSPHMFLPPLPEPFLNSFFPLTNIASQIPTSPPLIEKGEYDNNQPQTEIEDNLNNAPNAEESESELPRYPYPVPPHPIYNNPVNPQMQQPLPLFPPMASNALPTPNFQTFPYLQPPTPLYYPPPPNGPLPLNVFNATLIQQIADTLKTITSHY